jgi:hypothetical protein
LPIALTALALAWNEVKDMDLEWCRRPEDRLKHWNDVAKLIGRAWRNRKRFMDALKEQTDAKTAEEQQRDGNRCGEEVQVPSGTASPRDDVTFTST